MDRFLMKIYIDYPDATSEQQIVRLVRDEEKPQVAGPGERVTVPQQVIFDARKEIQNVYISAAIETYIVDLIFATRYPNHYSDELKAWIEIGASPRGSIGLDKCSRVHAWMQQRDYVTPMMCGQSLRMCCVIELR